MHGEPLTRGEVTSVINGRARARRVPMLIHFWTNPDAFLVIHVHFVIEWL
jgi:hypothetical protein